MKIWILILLILIQNYVYLNIVNDFTSELKDNGGNSIDITSQGAFTFILRSDNKIYKWDGTSAFVFFQGPVNGGADYLIRSVTVNELGVLWVCADSYNKLFKYINSAWTELPLTGTYCYNAKIGYGPLSILYLGKVGDYTYNSNKITYLNTSNSFSTTTIYGSTSRKMFSFSSDYSGILLTNLLTY